MKGNNTRANKTKDNTNKGLAIFSQVSMGTWKASNAMTQPTVMAMTWRIKKCVWV